MAVSDIKGQKTPSPKSKGVPTRVDQHVGSRLKHRRSLLGWSQEKVAESVGVTFQQVQKYERGLNRISASRLFQFSKTLDVPVSYFFEEYASDKSIKNLPGFSDNEQEGFGGENVFERKETIELVRTYYSISDPRVRQNLLKLFKSMAAAEREKG
jgi:transcriptional regulator with XRE-family HTH domain